HEGKSQEKERWEDAFEKINTKTGRTILDIGTGTGFVPLTISKFLNEKDTLICSDVSKKMLSIVEKKLKSSKFQLELKIIKERSGNLNFKKIDLKEKMVDYLLKRKVQDKNKGKKILQEAIKNLNLPRKGLYRFIDKKNT
ncbi:hypothetical protein LCGC14_2565130, partial [marine sediment metagenome]